MTIQQYKQRLQECIEISADNTVTYKVGKGPADLFAPFEKNQPFDNTFRKLQLAAHPDKGGSNAIMVFLTYEKNNLVFEEEATPAEIATTVLATAALCYLAPAGSFTFVLYTCYIIPFTIITTVEAYKGCNRAIAYNNERNTIISNESERSEKSIAPTQTSWRQLIYRYFQAFTNTLPEPHLRPEQNKNYIDYKKIGNNPDNTVCILPSFDLNNDSIIVTMPDGTASDPIALAPPKEHNVDGVD